MKKISLTISLIIILVTGINIITFAQTGKTVYVEVNSADNTDLVCSVVVYRQIGNTWVYHYSTYPLF